MRIADLDLDEEFQSIFTNWGTHIGECNCGRTHVCIDSYAFNQDEEHEKIKEDMIKLSKEDNKVILHHGYDHVSVMEIAGRHFVEDCECEGWRPYMDFIMQHRIRIKDFLIKVADKAQIALEREKTFNILKNKNLAFPSYGDSSS